MPIHHVILLKFKQGISPAEAENIRAVLRALPSQIPDIRGITAGTKIKHPLDRDFDECVIFVFDNEDALKKGYFPHKAHLDGQEYMLPRLEDKMMFDIYCEE